MTLVCFLIFTIEIHFVIHCIDYQKKHIFIYTCSSEKDDRHSLYKIAANREDRTKKAILSHRKCHCESCINISISHFAYTNMTADITATRRLPLTDSTFNTCTVKMQNIYVQIKKGYPVASPIKKSWLYMR
ncbi:hypothetical protein SAY86_019872 [Trapa natans]|uniref:Secreted protein n=1 Tax=Trapa natans TaxID=22666 RepID=A0AAN7R771_TRANT|nr:hypothetical protein SAY86_019872 [Trapa natans]